MRYDPYFFAPWMALGLNFPISEDFSPRPRSEKEIILERASRNSSGGEDETP